MFALSRFNAHAVERLSVVSYGYCLSYFSAIPYLSFLAYTVYLGYLAYPSYFFYFRYFSLFLSLLDPAVYLPDKKQVPLIVFISDIYGDTLFLRSRNLVKRYIMV